MGRQAHMLSSNIGAAEGTFSSQERFIRAVALAETPNVRALKLQSTNSNDALRSYDCISALVAQLESVRTIAFDWNVRFGPTGSLSRAVRARPARLYYAGFINKGTVSRWI